MYNWSGSVPANAENGQRTGLTLKQGDIISIVAKGWIRYGKESNMLAAPQGSITFSTNPEYNLVAKIGGKTYRIGNGVLHKTVPVDGELILLFSDTPGVYYDNSGEFQVDVIIESRYSPLDEKK
ncbi:MULTISPECIES: LecA/PA-IL family lectin [Photorhabdus]|uniref:PA-IL-like protein n=2 Tax=Photorhabdus asymbiotica TaxID=291112 RepID=A0ABX9SR84_9GAMM|nr:LecA/PA-IL family lectin [Photorhabdus asymbiotica]RKS65943.1 PA-IL-like protein [Photorhabdus asymbiotica]CAQ84161.1 similar to pa-i galactophilic lectin of pseudomonas aeruginosa [Photorhabdus asymbiotica]